MNIACFLYAELLSSMSAYINTDPLSGILGTRCLGVLGVYQSVISVCVGGPAHVFSQMLVRITLRTFCVYI